MPFLDQNKVTHVEEYKIRLDIEREELQHKINKLYNFIYFSPVYETLTYEEKDLLRTQLVQMNAYKKTLMKREKCAREGSNKWEASNNEP